MAHNPFPRKEHRSSWGSPTPLDNDSADKGKSKGVLDPSEVEFHSVKRKRRSKRQCRKSSGNTSTTTSQEPSETGGKRRPSRNHKRASNCSFVQRSVTSTTNEEDSGDERQCLLPRGSGSPNYGTSHGIEISSVEIQSPLLRRFFPEVTPSTVRYLSVVLFLLLLVLGITLVISSNIRSDRHGMEITPRDVNCYTIVLIAVFIIWLACDKWGNRKCSETVDKESGSLIPSHLLNGLAMFGVGSSVCQVVTVLDFVKCQRHVGKLDLSCLVYPFFEMAFMFSQIYVFYTLSRNRERKMLFGNAFTMFTLAVNLTIWAIYFFAGAVNTSALKSERWLTHYYYGWPDHDLCATNVTGQHSRELHQFRSDMKPFMYTLAMEYSLLASALLLHLWLGIGTCDAGEYGATNRKNWQFFRAGFILGLFCLPLLGMMAVNASVDSDHRRIMIVFWTELVLLILLFICSYYGFKQLKSSYTLDLKPVGDVERNFGTQPPSRSKPIRVDIILLCISWLGFLVVDLFTIFASCEKIFKNYDGSALGVGITSLFELLSTGMLTVFVVEAYSRRLPATWERSENTAAAKIRQIGSFSMIVSFGFWAMRTYTFRSKYTFDFVGSDYFGEVYWFVITQLSVPLCTFFHFHSGVCLAEVIASATM